MTDQEEIAALKAALNLISSAVRVSMSTHDTHIAAEFAPFLTARKEWIRRIPVDPAVWLVIKKAMTGDL